MTDRELLELSAKSSAFEVVQHIGDSAFFGLLVRCVDRRRKFRWNPLTEDGDALRLLASMREKFGPMLLAIFEDRVECGDVNYCQSIEDIVDGDIPRAVRRAITRAAAQIQLDKENKNA